MNLDQLTFRVSATAPDGIVSSSTRLRFAQRGSRVFGRYGGGTVRRGVLVGAVAGSTMRFRYAQVELTGHVHGGHSVCDIERLADGRLRLHEHFTWETRSGSGTNAFVQVAGG